MEATQLTHGLHNGFWTGHNPGMKPSFRASLQIILAAIGLVVFAIFGIVELVLVVLGVAAIPEDTVTTVGKAAVMLNWMIGMPWWVGATTVMIGAAACAWLLIFGVKALVGAQKLTVDMPDGVMTPEQARLLIGRVDAMGIAVQELSDSLDERNQQLQTSLHFLIDRQREYIEKNWRDLHSQTSNMAAGFQSLSSSVQNTSHCDGNILMSTIDHSRNEIISAAAHEFQTIRELIQANQSNSNNKSTP